MSERALDRLIYSAIAVLFCLSFMGVLAALSGSHGESTNPTLAQCELAAQECSRCAQACTPCAEVP